MADPCGSLLLSVANSKNPDLLPIATTPVEAELSPLAHTSLFRAHEPLAPSVSGVSDARTRGSIQ
jgi:hypothetical protein